MTKSKMSLFALATTMLPRTPIEPRGRPNRKSGGGADDVLCVDEFADGVLLAREGRGRQEDQRGAAHQKTAHRWPW